MTQTVAGLQSKRVTLDDFVRAETDNYIRSIAAEGLGRLAHTRSAVPVDDQGVVRMNRDTLYSHAVCDLDAGPVTLTLPDPGARYQALQVINQDHLTKGVFYGPGKRAFSWQEIGTRYVVFLVRTLADPQLAQDMAAANALQDQLVLEQAAPGSLDLPDWDQEDLGGVREGLKILGRYIHGLSGAFGDAGEVDPIHHLVGTAVGWGGNPGYAAQYFGETPELNDGKTPHRLRLKDVPADGFWSVSLYNAEGFFEKNAASAYSVNNLTAKPDPDGGVTIQFGGCDGTAPNCLPIMPGWNYLLRLYRPRPEVLDGRWTPPMAEPLT